MSAIVVGVLCRRRYGAGRVSAAGERLLRLVALRARRVGLGATAYSHGAQHLAARSRRAERDEDRGLTIYIHKPLTHTLIV